MNRILNNPRSCARWRNRRAHRRATGTGGWLEPNQDWSENGLREVSVVGTPYNFNLHTRTPPDLHGDVIDQAALRRAYQQWSPRNLFVDTDSVIVEQQKCSMCGHEKIEHVAVPNSHDEPCAHCDCNCFVD